MRLAAFAFLLPVSFLLGALTCSAQTPDPESGSRVELVIFWEPGCPYCQRAKAFLEVARRSRDWLDVRDYDVSASRAASDLFERAVIHFAIQRPGVPLLVVGGKHFVGFGDASTTGVEIMQVADSCHKGGCKSLAEVIEEGRPVDGPLPRDTVVPKTVDLPFIGPVPTASLSLPVLTVFLAAIDGFNPCAMWVLVFLVGLLVGMQDRVRMWLLGAVFLLTSGVVYFGFLAAWLNVFLLIGALFWVRIVVGCVALASGSYYLHAFATDAAAECRVTNPTQRRRIMDALRASVSEKRFLFAVAGIVVLAVAVNLIELICSAGIPAVFTDVLAMSDLPVWQYYAYLLLYVAVFMLDDAAIFVIAMTTLAATGMTNQYLRYSHLLGGVGMIVIGTLLLFAPGWLNFTV